MRQQLTPGELEQMLPAEPGLRAHCLRVAALARQVAAVLRLPPAAIPLLNQAALLHHQSALSPGPRLDRLFSDLIAVSASAAPGDPSVSAVPSETMEDRIVDACNLFDEQMEWLRREPKSVEEIVAGLAGLASGGMLDVEVVAALQSLTTSYRSRSRPFQELLPPAAGEVQSTFAALGGRCEFDRTEIERLASGDPLMAAALLRATNPTLHAPVTMLHAAIEHLGTSTASRILLAMALRPLLCDSGRELVWRHSIETSLWCERMAAALPMLDPQDAWLAGLLHDIGRVALALLPDEALAVHTGLLRSGCPPAYADMVVTGLDHGQIGGAILRAWNFPPSVVEAVCWHHQPERSKNGLTSLLYLSEFWDCSDEDLPSEFRLHSALARAVLTMQQLTTLGAAKNEADPLYTLLVG